MRWNGKRGGRRGESIIFMALSPLPGSFLPPWVLGYVQTQQKSKKTPYKRSDLEFGVLSHWSYFAIREMRGKRNLPKMLGTSHVGYHQIMLRHFPSGMFHAFESQCSFLEKLRFLTCMTYCSYGQLQPASRDDSVSSGQTNPSQHAQLSEPQSRHLNMGCANHSLCHSHQGSHV